MWLNALLTQNLQSIAELARALTIHLFFLLYGQKLPLPFNYTLANPSNGILQPAITSLLTGTMQNATTKTIHNK